MSQDAQRAGRAMSDATQAGAGVDVGRLAAFVSRQPEFSGARLRVRLDPSRRAAGASSGTALFDLDVDRPGAAPITRRLVFRYDLGGAFFRQYELAPQFETMRALRAAGFCAPDALWLDADGEVAGHPGLVMARIEAAAPSITPFQDGPLMAADPPARHEMLLDAARTLGRLHRLDSSVMGHLRGRGPGDHVIDRDLNWTLAEVRMALPPAAAPPEKAAFYREVRGVLEAVCEELRRTAPRDRTADPCHGDANITNFMYCGTEVAALLDYELSHLGVGEADLGYQLAGIAHFRLLAPPVDGIPSDAEMSDAYAEARGRFEDWPWARLMGEWRLAAFAAMGMSRLPPELAHIERTYWEAALTRMQGLAPEVVAQAVARAESEDAA